MNRELINQALYWAILAPCIAVLSALALSYAYDLAQAFRRRRARHLAEVMDPVRGLVRSREIRR